MTIVWVLWILYHWDIVRWIDFYILNYEDLKFYLNTTFCENKLISYSYHGLLCELMRMQVVFE